MIITLKGATASKNLGGLNFYSILVNKSSGVTVTLDKTTVDKATASSTTVTGTVTVADDYTLSSVVITMGGTDVTSSCYDESTGAITISGITGNVVVKATATSNSGSGDSGSGGTTPANYTITYKYMCGGTEIKTATTETVTAGTSKTFSVANAPKVDGYVAASVNPASATINGNTTVTYVYIEATQGETIWYVDNAEQTGKIFNYHGSFPGAAARIDSVASVIRGVPINVVKFYPSNAGTMFFARWVPGNMPTLAASIEVLAEDVYATAPANNAGAKTYMLSETITLAADERLLCKWNNPATTEDSAGFWVNAGAGGDYAVSVWKTADNTAGDENWGLPFSIGYIAE